MCLRAKLYFYAILNCFLLYGQNHISADPFYLFKYEQNYFLNNDDNQSLLIRPLIGISENNSLSIIARNEVLFNEPFAYKQMASINMFGDDLLKEVNLKLKELDVPNTNLPEVLPWLRANQEWLKQA